MQSLVQTVFSPLNVCKACPILQVVREVLPVLTISSPTFMAAQANRKRDYAPPPIPDRLYFKIGDVARLCGVEAYVLRFWESQFPQLKPNKSGTGQRLYRRRDVELALDIKRLVHAEGYTLSGARAVLDAEQRRPGKRSGSNVEAEAAVPSGGRSNKSFDATAAVIGHARAELREIINLLASPAQPPRRRSRLTAIAPATGTLFPS
jgi:DNA-binding transcriptional MerR regulator